MTVKVAVFNKDGSIDKEKTQEVIRAIEELRIWSSYFVNSDIATAVRLTGLTLEEAYECRAGLSEKGLAKINKTSNK